MRIGAGRPCGDAGRGNVRDELRVRGDIGNKVVQCEGRVGEDAGKVERMEGRRGVEESAKAGEEAREPASRAIS